MCSTIKRILPLLTVVLLAFSSFGQSGNQGSLRTTNSPFAGALLTTDGSKYYWSYPTNLQVNATNAQPPSSVLTNLSSTGAVTNKFNSWELWADPVVTNRYHAENRALGITTNSVDFSALLQSLANRGVEGFSYRLKANPFYTNAYILSNTVVFTNWGTVYADSSGNPTVVIRAAPNFSGALVQLGTAGNRIGGISRWTGLRFESDQGATNATGMEIVNVVEPVIRDCEFTGYKLAGIHYNTTNSCFWSDISGTWFVNKFSANHGILFSATPIDSFVGLNHANIWNNTFGLEAGRAITVSNYWPGITIQNNKLFSTGSEEHGIGAYAGGNLVIQGNTFQNFNSGYPVILYDRLSTTNYASDISFNNTDESGPLLIVGDFITGVQAIGNTTRTGDAVFLTGNNGFINMLDQSGLRLGTLAKTNALLYADADGIVRPAELSGLTFSSGTLTAVGGGAGSLPANANQFSTNTTLAFISGALVTNLVARGITLPNLTTDRALYVNGSGNVTNSPNVTATELEYLDGLTAPISTSLSNQVRVAAGTGGITVTPSGSGGVMTYTINDDDAGGGGGGTNNPVLLEGPQTTLISSQTARSQWATNQSYTYSIIGSSNQSSRVQHFAHNVSTNTIYMSNSVAIFSALDGSNVTAFPIPPGAILELNIALDRSNRWVAATFTKEYQLVPDGTTITGTYDHTAGTYTLTAIATASVTNRTSLTISNVIRYGQTNIVVSDVTPVHIDLSRFGLFSVKLLTNANLVFTNVYEGLMDARVVIQQDTNGQRTVNWSVAGGYFQTNANMQVTTNANARDVLELMADPFFPTNVLAWWPQDFQPRVPFTNSLAGGVAALPLELSTDPAAGAYSVARKLTNGWTGALALVVRSSDSATNYVVASGTGNNIADIVTWAGSDSVYVTNLFDQTGNGRHLAQGNTNLCFAIVTNGVAVSKNGHTVMDRVGADASLTSGSVTINQPVSMIFNVYSDSITSSDIFVNGNSTTRTTVKQLSPSSYRLNAGSNVDTGTLTADQWDIIQVIYLPTATGPDSLAVDGGSFGTGEAGDTGMTAIVIGSTSVCADMLFGDFILWSVEADTGEMGAIRDDFNLYWSIY